MQPLANCPYCDNRLLRHARHQGVYWFCTSCRQEVPSLMSSLSFKQDTATIPAMQPFRQSVRQGQLVDS